jgi:hypothetical protein
MIRRPALVSLKRHASSDAQPTQLASLGRAEDDVTVEHREVDWHDDRSAVRHVTDTTDDRLLQKVKALLSGEGLELGLLKVGHLRFLRTQLLSFL